MEVKHLPLDIEVKADGEEGEFTGYGSVFEVVDSQGDKITKGAFTSSLVKRMPKMLWQHDLGEPIGKWTEAREDSKGLYLRGKLSLGTTRGRDAYALMKDGALDGLSIGYRVPSGGAAREGNMRVLKEIDLWEVSLVTIPALSVAMVDGIKSGDFDEESLEELLRRNGFSRTTAKAVVARGFKGYRDVLREAGVSGPEIDLREADELKRTLQSLINEGASA
jgi:HK97 family phage prohead protease